MPKKQSKNDRAIIIDLSTYKLDEIIETLMKEIDNDLGDESKDFFEVQHFPKNKGKKKY